MERMTTREWQQAFEAGEFNSPSVTTQIRAGWYDWFCRDTALAKKTQRMGGIIKKVRDGGKIDLDKTYVWFKNNCPLVGPLYDDFRIADRESGETLITICCDDKRSSCKYEVWGSENGFDGPLIGFKDSRELVKWLNAAE